MNEEMARWNSLCHLLTYERTWGHQPSTLFAGRPDDTEGGHGRTGRGQLKPQET